MSAKRLKLASIFTAVGLSALVLLSWTQEWFAIRLGSGETLSIAGDVAAPALTALALSGLALAGALAIAGPVFRVILGLIQVSIGALVITSAVLALGDPVAASAREITQATGVSGDESIAALVSAAVASPWPAVTVVLGILLALLGLATALTTRYWPVSSRKYQAVRLEETDGSPVADWDALSDGRDPTGPDR